MATKLDAHRAHWTDMGQLKWVIHYDYATVERLNKAGFCITEALFQDLLEDVFRFARFMFVACETQAKENNVDQSKMFDLVKGDSMFDAYAAAAEATKNFFPPKRFELFMEGINVAFAKLGLAPIGGPGVSNSPGNVE